MNDENLRVRVTKRMLREGLMRCLARKNIDKLSVTELCREADVNRATFYNHYEVPRDILYEIGQEIAEKMKHIFEANQKIPMKDRIEGCLSIPDKSGWVKRANHVIVRALNEEMKPFELEGEGLLARAIQHELEHLDGHLYVEHVEGGEQGLISNDRLRPAEE